jgi:PilZ domain-containing protein
MERERRAFLRVETDITVTCAELRPDGERGTPVRRTALNLSAGGVKLTAAASGQRLSPGSRQWLEIEFRNPRFLVFTEAEVVRVDEDGEALQFTPLEVYTEQRVVRWVYAQDRRLFERHVQARIPLRLRALCRRLGPAGEPVEEFAAATVDFALDGIRVRSDRVLPDGTAVDVEIDFQDGLPPFSSRATARPGEPEGDRREYVLDLDAAGPALRRSLIERALAAERRIGS